MLFFWAVPKLDYGSDLSVTMAGCRRTTQVQAGACPSSAPASAVGVSAQLVQRHMLRILTREWANENHGEHQHPTTGTARRVARAGRGAKACRQGYLDHLGSADGRTENLKIGTLYETITEEKPLRNNCDPSGTRCMRC